MKSWIGPGVLAVWLGGAVPAAAQGFEPLDAPRFVSAAQADFLRDNDRVLGVAGNGVAKAYPVPVLTWHHIVNQDRLGDLPILPTW